MALFGLGMAEVCFGGDVDASEQYMREALEIDLRASDVLSAAYRMDGLAWSVSSASAPRRGVPTSCGRDRRDRTRG
ncbi:hypothetical protein [Amycolatopsis decaplanina]|uniref:Uncharacterized protein n=1 Tax=Amycolatopsis decaplanina DSM 44594 TaxID=1284240 RepID=M2Z616_9PSEU|nr:hypothetical protein [Amycolatopsis decaplanina]EME62692.1 hypothetical protein H074_08361 [Amycolatopsis decaplanina DSM 44594]